MLDGEHYILINLYNANTSSTCKKCDFNTFFNSKLEARGGKKIHFKIS